MGKSVWILNHYASVMFFDKGGRHYNFAKYLKHAGYDPTVFCCNAKHNKAETYFPDMALWQEYMADEISVPFIFVQGRTYEGNGKQRVLNMIDFYRNVKKTAKEYAKLHGKPDVIYASSVHPLTLVAGIQLAKKFGVKCICEVRDLWPQSIVEFSTRLKKNNPLICLLYHGEKWIYQKADALIFTMEGAYNYIIEQGWEKKIPQEKVHYINNGVDLDNFDLHVRQDTIKDPDLNETSRFRVTYAGSIRQANNVGLIVGCAEKLRDFPDIQFLIYGSGPDADYWRQYCIERNIKNCIFKGEVKRQVVPYILSQSNLNLLNYDQKIVKIFRYGSSQNKMFEYLASGKPLLANAKIAYTPIEKYHCGLSQALQDADAYAQAILSIYHLSEEEREQMGNNARKAAEEYDFKYLTQKLCSVIEGV